MKTKGSLLCKVCNNYVNVLARDSCIDCINEENEDRGFYEPGMKYNYEHRVWTKNGVVKPCGHPETLKPGCCNADKYKAMTIEDINLQKGRI